MNLAFQEWFVVSIYFIFLNQLQMSVQITRLLFLVSCTQALQIEKYWFRLCNIEIQVTQLVSIIHTYLFLSIIDVNCVIHMNVPRFCQINSALATLERWNKSCALVLLFICCKRKYKWENFSLFLEVRTSHQLNINVNYCSVRNVGLIWQCPTTFPLCFWIYCTVILNIFKMPRVSSQYKLLLTIDEFYFIML